MRRIYYSRRGSNIGYKYTFQLLNEDEVKSFHGTDKVFSQQIMV